MSEATTITRGRVGFTPGLWTSWLHSQTMSPASQMWLRTRSVLGSSFTPTEIKLHADERTMQARPGIKRVFCSINPSAGVTAAWIYCPPFKTEAAKQNICGDELERTSQSLIPRVQQTLTGHLFLGLVLHSETLPVPLPPETSKLGPTHDYNLPEGFIGQCFLKCDSCLNPGMIKSLSEAITISTLSFIGVFHFKHLNYENYQEIY